jgi:hypothetical protein
LTAAKLMNLAEAALRITGTPAFTSADYEGEIDSLQFVESDDTDDCTWAFVPIPLDEHGHPHGCGCGHDHGEERGQGIEGSRADIVRGGQGVGRAMPAETSPLAKGGLKGVGESDDDLDDSILPIDTALAAELIKSHLRDWLADRGWQVQLEMFKNDRRWRLADCLSFTDGGGDRLDADYPAGDDELKVLCDSVVAVNST